MFSSSVQAQLFYQHDTHLIFHLRNTECLPSYTFVGRIDSLSHHILKTWTTIKSKTPIMDVLRPFQNDASFSMGVVRMGADSLPPHAEHGKSKIRIYTGLNSQDGGLANAGGDFPDTTIYNCKYPLLSFPSVHFSAALGYSHQREQFIYFSYTNGYLLSSIW